MKFTSRLFGAGVLVASTVLLLFTATSVNACEADCRDGISHAFADKYAIEVVPRFNSFNTNLNKTLFKSFNIKDFVPASKVKKCKTELPLALKKRINALKKKFTTGLAPLIQKAIFEQNPKFKGQCQKPLKVVQPPAGQPWADSDCDKQDYICGNPPAICHFMGPIVKPRNVKNVIQFLSSNASKNGTFFKDLNSEIKKVAATKCVTNKSKLNRFINALTKNVQKALASFVKDFGEKFCSKTSCDKYDREIKKLLLSFP